MPRQSSLFALIPLVAALAACHDTTAPEPLAAATAKAKATWSAAAILSYTFTASRSCECTPDAVGPVRITVAGGHVSSVVVIATGQPAAPERWFDIDGLFTTIETELAARPTLVEATFDGTTGVPTHVKYGDLAIDAGADITIADFARALQ